MGDSRLEVLWKCRGLGRTWRELERAATSREEDERRIPGRLGLAFIDWTGRGDEDLPLDGDPALCSLDVFEDTFLICLGGGSFSDATATLDVLSRNA